MKKRLRNPLHYVSGLAGVAQDETNTSKRWASMLELPMLLLAIWIIIEWYFQARNEASQAIIAATNWVIWLFFFIETTVSVILVREKARYLKQNWVNLIIIFFSFPLIWWFTPLAGALRILRLVVMFSLIMQISGSARKLLSAHHLGTTLFVALVVVIMAGFTIAGLDPGIESPADGIWWALVTITTVGYGDLVPHSDEGRLFASFIIILGLALFSVLTASFSAFFISEDEAGSRRREAEILTHLQRLEKEIKVIKELLKENSDQPSDSKKSRN